MTVVGGGILGVSVALLLRLLGVEADLVTAERPDRLRPGAADPDLASAYPAASLVPHSVDPGDAEGGPQGDSGAALAASMEVFAALHRRLPELVRAQWHYELFAGPAPRAGYLALQRDVERLGAGGAAIPEWVGPGAWEGWRFRLLFVEYPAYLRRLYAAFEGLGGEVRLGRLGGPADLAGLAGGPVVVCAGMGSPRLLGRDEDLHFEEGWLVHLPVPRSALPGEPVSYNLHPGPAVHPGAGGEGTAGMDVYAYPRRRDLVLGGTRLPGVVRRGGDGRAEVAAYRGDTVEIPGPDGRPRPVPRPIVTLNREILERLYRLDLARHSMRCTAGRRYRGPSPDAAPTRVNTSIAGRRVLACYGLGGAGVTLSWGLALDLARRVVGEGGVPKAGEIGERVANDILRARS